MRVTECRQDVAVPRQRRLPSASPAATHHRALPDAPDAPDTPDAPADTASRAGTAGKAVRGGSAEAAAAPDSGSTMSRNTTRPDSNCCRSSSRNSYGYCRIRSVPSCFYLWCQFPRRRRWWYPRSLSPERTPVFRRRRSPRKRRTGSRCRDIRRRDPRPFRQRSRLALP